MKRFLLASAIILCGIAIYGAAKAQQPDSIATLTEDWNAYQNAQRHVTESVSKVANELQKARADLAVVTKERDDLKAQIEKRRKEDDCAGDASKCTFERPVPGGDKAK